MAHELTYFARAVDDLENIYQFIAQDSPLRARQFVGKIQQRCDLLRDAPEQGRTRADLRNGLRVVPYGRSVVIAYQVTADAIEVLRIFYGGQDYETIMTGDTPSRSQG
jgi:toxin ParE1/3/4